MKKTFTQLAKLAKSLKTSTLKKPFTLTEADTQIQNSAFIRMPKTFDFIAYFDEAEAENDSGEIMCDNSPEAYLIPQ